MLICKESEIDLFEVLQARFTNVFYMSDFVFLPVSVYMLMTSITGVV